MKKIIFIAVVLATVGFTSSSREQVVQKSIKESVQKVHQAEMGTVQVAASAKETSSWD